MAEQDGTRNREAAPPARGQPPTTDREQETRNLAQLLRIQEELLGQLQKVRSELSTPTTAEIIKQLRHRTGTKTEESFGKITAAVEEGIRALKLFESEVKQQLFDNPDDLAVEGIPNLPAHLARFLAERAKLDGFAYEVLQDPERGWLIRWKEHTSRGTVRGYGQIFERPHAWLEE